MERIRKKIKSWCRYWHFNVWGVLSDNDGHRNYLDAISCLDDWNDTLVWEGDSPTLETIWPKILNNINSCTDEQILELEKYCNSRKD